MKKGNTPMEFDLKGRFKSTVEETKLKEKIIIPFLLFGKSLFGIYIISSSFGSLSASFKNSLI